MKKGITNPDSPIEEVMAKSTIPDMTRVQKRRCNPRPSTPT